MSPENAIEVRDLSKKFCRYLKRSMAYGFWDIIRTLFGISFDRTELREGEFMAVRGVSFDVKKGETLGVLGLNGAGKSTLLRMISGIYPPDSGEVKIRGRLGSLIALGAGFHPHMTGRENIKLNGTILGMTPEELLRKTPDIIAFSEIGSFMDSPVSTYSSGMTVRLGFAIAIHCSLDVMIIDEVLSVGDLSFQNKCLRKIYEKKKTGTSFIFVSHSIDTLRTVCDRALLMVSGEVKSEGGVDEVVMDYNRLIRETKLQTLKEEAKTSLLVRSDQAELLDIGIMDVNGQKTSQISYGEDIRVFWRFKTIDDLPFPAVGIGIKDDRAFNIVYSYSLNDKQIKFPEIKKGQTYQLEVTFRTPNIKPGVYGLNCAIVNSKTDELYLHVLNTGREQFKIQSPEVLFKVDGNLYVNNAVVELKTDWDMKEVSP